MSSERLLLATAALLVLWAIGAWVMLQRARLVPSLSRRTAMLLVLGFLPVVVVGTYALIMLVGQP